MSSMRVNHVSSILLTTPKKRDHSQSYHLCKHNQWLEALSKLSSKAFKNFKKFNLYIRKFKKKSFKSPSNISNFIGSSLKTLRNFKRIQISEALQNPVFKSLKNFHYKFSEIKNIHQSHYSKSKSSTKIKLQSLQKFQEL